MSPPLFLPPHSPIQLLNCYLWRIPGPGPLQQELSLWTCSPCRYFLPLATGITYLFACGNSLGCSPVILVASSSFHHQPKMEGRGRQVGVTVPLGRKTGVNQCQSLETQTPDQTGKGGNSFAINSFKSVSPSTQASWRQVDLFLLKSDLPPVRWL